MGGDIPTVPRTAAEVEGDHAVTQPLHRAGTRRGPPQPGQGAGEGWQPSPLELGERQFREACFEALTSKKGKCLLNKR